MRALGIRRRCLGRQGQDRGCRRPLLRGRADFWRRRSGSGASLFLSVCEVLVRVKTSVHSFEQSPFVLAVDRAGGDAVIEPQTDLGDERLGVLFEFRHDSVCQALGAPPLGLGEEDGELVAADTARNVRATNGLDARPPYSPKDFIPCGMPVSVVDGLEAAQVKHQQRQMGGVAGGPVQFPDQTFLEEASVIKSGQRVRRGCVPQALKFAVFHQDVIAQQRRLVKIIHGCRPERDRPADLPSQVVAAVKDCLPMGDAFIFG